jgi:hypothetical protein
VRITYLDEAGTSASEPFFAVAAILIEADKQLAAVERYVEDLVETHIPKSTYQKGQVRFCLSRYGHLEVKCPGTRVLGQFCRNLWITP